ncbi:Hypothetical predicted protein [Mytilus galloprovincialis]|uniref:Uncharacterized protein n=1 Tax=Mytilus galloprovincialis TaxID=29158 RepID=A0A8B6EXA5_MYTGA|nr:Hypothetical predicted protein [Mytilus galloprovincialis]
MSGSFGISHQLMRKHTGVNVWSSFTLLRSGKVPGSVQHQRELELRRTPVVSKGVSSRASVQSSMTVTRPEAIYTTSGHDGAAIPTTATTVPTTRMLMPTFSSNQDNSVHIPDMLPWQPRRAIDPQPTVDNTQFVSQTGNVTNNDYVQIPNRIESVHENLGINVTQSIKEKILKGEFIDLACLLKNSVNTGSDKQKLTWAQGEFILQPISQQSKITNIEKWTDAFIIFIYILLCCARKPI